MITTGYLIPGFTSTGFGHGVSRLFKTDLTTIEDITTPPPGVQSVTRGRYLWVAACTDGPAPDGGFVTAMWTSTDGYSWAPQTSPLDRAWCVIWTGERFIAAGQSDSTDTRVATSLDGVTWTAAVLPGDGMALGGFGEIPKLQFIAGDGDTWVVTGATSTSDAGGAETDGGVTTDSGATWSALSLPTLAVTAGTPPQVGPVQIGHGPTGWLGISDAFDAYYLLHSSDGQTWTVIGTPNTVESGHLSVVPVVISERIGTYGPVAARGGTWLVVANDDDTGDPLFLTTTDAVTFDGPLIGLEFINVAVANDVLFGTTEVPTSEIYFSDDLIDFWADFTDLRSGSSSTVYGHGFGGSAIGYGDFLAPPQRQYPRDDGLGASSRRSWPPSQSAQHGLRRGGVNTYQ